MKCNPLPTREELLRWLSYDPETGVVTRVADPMGRRTYLGPITYTNGRSVIVAVCSRYYVAARIIWRIMTGDDPGELEVDHEDGDYSNDRWANLRLAERVDQMANIGLRRDNKYGHKGVIKTYNGYRARLRRNGEEYWSVLCDTPELAAVEYEKLALQHHQRFART